jgi:hypothetical protein
MHLKQNKDEWVPILLTDINGAEVLSVTDAHVEILKTGTLVPYAVTVSASNWHEIGAAAFPGLYYFKLLASDVDTPGPITISAKSASSITTMCAHLVVASMAEDVRLAVDLVRQLVGNAYKIDKVAATLTIFGDDGTTAIRTFYLKDELGVANATRIFERSL